MLETIREYAAERLDAANDVDAIRQAHAEWFLRLAEKSAEEWRGANGTRWLVRFNHEIGNLRAALAWGAEHDPVLALSAAAGAWLFWGQTERSPEGRRFIEETWDEKLRPIYGYVRCARSRPSRWRGATFPSWSTLRRSAWTLRGRPATRATRLQRC